MQTMLPHRLFLIWLLSLLMMALVQNLAALQRHVFRLGGERITITAVLRSGLNREAAQKVMAEIKETRLGRSIASSRLISPEEASREIQNTESWLRPFSRDLWGQLPWFCEIQIDNAIQNSRRLRALGNEIEKSEAVRSVLIDEAGLNFLGSLYQRSGRSIRRMVLLLGFILLLINGLAALIMNGQSGAPAKGRAGAIIHSILWLGLAAFASWLAAMIVIGAAWPGEYPQPGADWRSLFGYLVFVALLLGLCISIDNWCLRKNKPVGTSIETTA